MTDKTALETLETPEEFLARALVVARETLKRRDERLAALEAENYRLAADNKGMSLQLDRADDYLSIKRVAALNGLPWASINWRALKAESMKSEHGVRRAFASSYGQVNTYHINVWRSVYPDFVYGVPEPGQPEKTPESPAQIPKERSFEVYPLKDDGTHFGKPLIFTYEHEDDIREAVNRLKVLNPHLDFEVVLLEN